MSALESVRFSVFEVDLRTRELRKHGVRLKIQEQPFQVLEALVERPGELVTRQELQRRIWGAETIVDFDQSLNRAVNKLRDALGDGAESPRFVETVPRRGYRFIGDLEPAPVQDVPPTSNAGPVQAGSGTHASRRMRWLVAAAGVVSFAAVASIWMARNNRVRPLPRVVSLTAFSGTESHVAFSPDGKQIAFAWNGEKQDNTDIYAKVIGEPGALRLTTDAAFDGYPAWSPDGRQIAFFSDRGRGGIYVISAIGGQERKLADVSSNSRLAWSPEGKFLLAAKSHQDGSTDSSDGALFLIPIETGEAPRAVLGAPRGTWYIEPSYKPGGGALAVAACTGSFTGSNCSIEIFPVQHGLPSAHPERLTPATLKVLGLAWSADGSAVVYSTQNGNDLNLWRVSVADKRSEQVEIAGSGASYPAVDPNTGRLAYSRRIADDDIWRLHRGSEPSAFLTSSRIDTSAEYSEDGRHVVFSSGREGEGTEVWVADADGSRPTQITRMGKFSGSPRWSPDGRWIAFDSRASGWNVWVVDAGGGSPRQLTQGAFDSVIPSWSRDGKSIYFASNRSGRFQIWRIDARGGSPFQVTRNGGYVAFESSDGKALYYTLSDSGSEGLYAKDLPNGREHQLIESPVVKRGFAILANGIYYLASRSKSERPYGTWLAPFQTPNEPYEIRFFRFATGQSEAVNEIKGPLHLGLTVSADQKTFLFTKISDSGADLMLIDNYR
jgi:Tol biopolymer transport system component/DNA-binding winged helix-turn-helix (wHTH) protein